MSGNNVSHSNRKTKRRFRPNLASRVMVVDGVKKKVNICVHCLKSLYKK
jgi:large subunit ribosomal protein L28